ALENAALRGGDAAAERTARDDLRTRRIGGRIEIRHTVRAADTESAPRLLDLRDCSLEIAVALERGFDQRLEAGIVDEVPPAEQAGARAFERVAGVLRRIDVGRRHVGQRMRRRELTRGDDGAGGERRK